MNNAQIGDKILSYDNEQTTQINDNKNQIEAVEQSVTALDTKLSVDYVVDFGSNPNGSWEKWASGKLVCRGVFTATNGTTQEQGGIFRSAAVQTQSYAMNFISAPEVDLKTQHFSAMDAMINAITNGSFSFRLLHYASQTVDTPVLYIAVGRWK